MVGRQEGNILYGDYLYWDYMPRCPTNLHIIALLARACCIEQLTLQKLVPNDYLNRLNLPEAVFDFYFLALTDGSSQNYGPFLGIVYIMAPNIS